MTADRATAIDAARRARDLPLTITIATAQANRVNRTGLRSCGGRATPVTKTRPTSPNRRPTETTASQSPPPCCAWYSANGDIARAVRQMPPTASFVSRERRRSNNQAISPAIGERAK